MLLASAAKGGSANLLRLSQGNSPRRVEQERLGPVQPRQQVDDKVESSHHVGADLLVTQIPAALLLDEMEDPLPRFGVGNVDHPAKDSPVGRRAEDRRAQYPVEMLIGMRMVAKDQLLRGPAETVGDVGIEAALPVAVAERRR